MDGFRESRVSLDLPRANDVPYMNGVVVAVECPRGLSKAWAPVVLMAADVCVLRAVSRDAEIACDSPAAEALLRALSQIATCATTRARVASEPLPLSVELPTLVTARTPPSVRSLDRVLVAACAKAVSDAFDRATPRFLSLVLPTARFRARTVWR